MSDPVTPTAPATPNADLTAILAELKRANDIREKAAAPAPVATQTVEQAAQGAADVARAMADKAKSDAERDLVLKQLQAQIEKAELEMAVLREQNKPSRRSEYNLRDASAFMGEAMGLSPKTKGFYGRVGAAHAAGSSDFARTFGAGLKPLDVLMCGAIVQGIGPFGNTAMKVLTVGEHDEVLHKAQRLADGIMVWQLARNEPVEQCPLYADFRAAMTVLGKALDTTDTSNWVPTAFSSRLLERYELERKIVPMLETYQVTKFPEEYYVVGARTTTYMIAENTADPESATAVPTSDLADAKVTLTRKTLGARSSYSYELDADSIIKIGDRVIVEQAKSIAFTEEQVLISGDTTSPHQDTDVTAADDARKAWKGWRKHAIEQSYTTDISAHTYESYTGMIGSMGNFGVNGKDLFWVIPPVVRAKLLVLKDANNHPVWYGAAVSGAKPYAETVSDVPTVAGIPVIVSEAFRTDLNSSGIYDGTTGKCGVLLVNRAGWVYAYDKPAPMVDSQKWIRTRQFEVVSSLSRQFVPTHAIASNKTVWYGIKVTT